MIDMTVLSTIAIFIVSPIATKLTKRFEFARDMGVVINGVFSIVLFIAAWAILDREAENLWPMIERGMAVGLGGSALVAGYRKSMKDKR